MFCLASCVNFFPLDTFCAVVTSWAANLGPGDPTCTFSGDGNSSQWLAFAVVIASRQRFYQQDSTIKLQNTCAKLPKKMYHQRWRYWAKADNHPTIKTNDWKTNLLMFRAPLNEALPNFFPTNLGRPSVSTWWERPNWTVRYRLGDIRCSFETWHRDDTYQKKQWNKWFIIQSGRSKAVVSLKKKYYQLSCTSNCLKLCCSGYMVSHVRMFCGATAVLSGRSHWGHKGAFCRFMLWRASHVENWARFLIAYWASNKMGGASLPQCGGNMPRNCRHLSYGLSIGENESDKCGHSGGMLTK